MMGKVLLHLLGRKIGGEMTEHDSAVDFVKDIMGLEPVAAADAIRERLGDEAAAELGHHMRIVMDRARSPIWRMVYEDSGGDTEYADAVVTYLALALSNFVAYNNKFTRWQPLKQGVSSVFTGHWFPMLWDFAEVNPFSDVGGSFLSRVEYLARVVERLPPGGLDVNDGKAIQAHAAELAEMLGHIERWDFE